MLNSMWRHINSASSGSKRGRQAALRRENARFSAGRGEYMVTDRTHWDWRFLPEQQAFHVHAMATISQELYAATSAWWGGLQRSTDGGSQWQVVYEHATKEGYVSRITALAALDGVLYLGLTDYTGSGPKLLRLVGGKVEPGESQSNCNLLIRYNS